MKKIAKLIAISLCLATTTFAMEDASFVEEVDYDGRAVLFNLKSALEVIQVVTPEALQRLVNKKQSNSGLVDHCSALCETLLAMQEDAKNFGTGLTTFEAILVDLPDSEEVIDPLTASFIESGDSDLLASSFADFSLMSPASGALTRLASLPENINNDAEVSDHSSVDEEDKS